MLSKKLLSTVLLISVVGCATEPDETTGIGALTGGALGAGLGAIIGSQTGDPGSGVAIGAAAGTLAGTVIGNEVQATDEKVALREERVARQQARIDSNRRQLNSLRDIDPDASYSRSQSTGGNTAQDLFNGRTAGASESDPRRAGYSPRAVSKSSPSKREAARARYSSRSAISVAGSSKPKQKAAEPKATLPRSATPATLQQSGESPSSEVERDRRRNSTSASTSIEADTSPSSIFSPLGSEPIEDAPRENTSGTAAFEPIPVEPIVQGAAPTQEDLRDPEAREVAALMGTTPVEEISSECRQAREEEQRAQSASELPDILFHLRRALRLCPSEPAFHVSMGDAYLKAKRAEDAMFEYKEALKLNPGYGPALTKVNQLESDSE